jgi:hypothetical protein
MPDLTLDERAQLVSMLADFARLASLNQAA